MAYYPKLYPEAWDRAIRRLPELKAMARLGRTKVYGINKPEHLTFQQWVFVLLDRMTEEDKKIWSRRISQIIKRWSSKTSVPFPEKPLRVLDTKSRAATSWHGIAMEMQRNDRIGSQGGSRTNLV